MLHQNSESHGNGHGDAAPIGSLRPAPVETMATNLGTVLLSGTSVRRKEVSIISWLCPWEYLPFGRFYYASYLIWALLLLALLNLFLSAWIITSLRLHQTLNPLKNYQSGQNHGNLQIHGTLKAASLQTNSIESELGVFRELPRPLVVEPAEEHAQLHLSHMDPESGLENSLTLRENSLEVKTSNLHIANGHKPTDQTVMQVTGNELTLNGETSKLKAPTGGLRVTTQLNTTQVRSSGPQDFRIESRTESVRLSSEKTLQVDSMSGQVKLNAYASLLLEGSLYLDSANIQMPHLRRQGSISQPEHNWRHLKSEKPSETSEPIAYQLCVCGQGQLFAADVDSSCEADSMICAN